MSFADYVKKRRSGEIPDPKKEEKKSSYETAGSKTGFAEYVKKRRSGEIFAPVKLNDYNPTAANVLGQYGRGNIDLFNRPQYKNPDGTVSTVRSMSFGTDEGEILVPTIGFDKDGKPYSMSEDEAIDNYYKTGQYLGKFKSVQEANNYANLLHKQQEAYYHPHKETNIFSDAIEAYKNRVDMSKLKYREGLNPNQTIGGASEGFVPATPEPANLTREGQWAAKHPLAGLGMYAVTSYIGGGEGAVNMLDAARREAMGQGKIGANEINAAPLAQAYRTGASEGIRRYIANSNENLPRVIRTVGNIDSNDGVYSSSEQALDFLTGVGADAASSSLNMAMGGNLSTYLMGTNAANQSLYDTANDEKTTSGQALALAAANGIAEAFFEHFSVENAGAVQRMFRRNPVSIKDFAKTLVVSAGVEGSEEMNTEIANILSDIFIRGENSESGRMYANAVRNGADPNAAAAEVLRSNLYQIGMAGLGGALSGGLHTGLYSSVGTMQRGMDLHNVTSAADIMDTIDTSTKEGQTAYDIASEIAKKEASGKRATAIDYGRLQNAINNAVEAASEAAPSTENAVPSTEEPVPSTDDVEIREAPRGDFLSTDAIRQTAENVRAQMDADYQDAFNEMYGADTEGIRNWGGDVEGSKENKRSYHIPVETLVRIDEDNRQNKTYSGLGRYGQETFDAQSFGRDAYDSATSLYNSIRFGQDLTEAEKMRNARLLTDDQVFNISQAAFKDLNSFYNWDRAGKISAIAEKHTLKDVTPGKVTYADGIDIDAIRSDGSKEGRIKAAQMAYAEGLLAKVFGYNVHWIQSRIDDNTGRYIDENGSYDPSTHTISLDINAGANYVGDTVAYVTAISHELTHTMELGAIDQYKKIADSIINVLVNDEEYSRGRNAQQIIADMIENNPHVHNEADAIHELVAQACEDMLNGNRDIQEMLAGLDEAEQKSFFDRISDIFNSILQFIEDMLSSDTVRSDRREAEALRRAKEEIEGLQTVWNEGVKNAAIATKLADFGVVEGDGNVSVENSERSWSDTDKQKLLEALVEAGYDKKKAQKWIRDVSSISAMIAADRNRLDYVAAENQTMLKPNQEYIKTLDASTLCAKRQLYQGTYNAIQRLLPNTPLLSEEVIRIRGLLNEHGLESPCGICYVESRRRNLGRFASRWLNTYEGEYKPTIAEVTSTDGLENLRKTHPDTYADYIAAMKKKGVSNPKVVELRTDYRGEINDLTKGQIEKITRIGGLRVQSFSDFETVHTIDMMQAVLDMAANGLTAQAYTKVPAFAAIFGNTGIKINLSLIGDVDENGNLTFDDKEGINHEEAFKLRKKYGKNVGTILVGRNDAHILAAMADPRIDFIIPFHRSGWGKRQFAQLGLDNYSDYTKSQNEKNLDGSKIKEGNLYPIDYWDYSKSGKENAERYLEICAEQGRIPKFSQFLTNNHDGSWSLKEDGSTDGYWKLLIDFKMYDNNGVGAPQEKVTGQFNMTEARKILDSFDGNADSLPVAQEVVDEFVKEFKEKHPRKQYSSRDIETAADDPNDTSVIRMGSEKDIKYSTRFAKGINDRLRVHMGTFFAGTGTVDFALRNIVSHQFAVEYDAKIAALYKLNNNGGTVYADDVRNVKVDPYKGRVEYFHASPVCKSYSGANNDSGEKPLDIETARATARAIEELNPKVVTIENVARYRNSNAIKIIEEALTKNGYTFDKGVYKATDFGGATIRERMFIRAVKDGVLPDINEYKEAPKSWYSVVEDLIDKLPEEPLSNYMEERLEASGIDIDNLTQPVLVLGGNKGEKLTYAYADKPSPTIIANSTESRIIMPDGRVLRAVPRVLARIQGLPDDFNLGLKDDFDMEKSRGGVTRAYTVVGNGVTTQLTEGVFEPLLKANIIDKKSQETGISYSTRDIEDKSRVNKDDTFLKAKDAAKNITTVLSENGYKYSYYGIRSTDYKADIGEELPVSHNLADDADEEELNGVSATGFGTLWYDEDDIGEVEKALKTHIKTGYEGEYHYLIGGNESEYGNDDSEVVIRNAEVVGIIAKDGTVITDSNEKQYSYRDNTINGYTPSSIGSLEELMRYNSGIRDMSAGLAAALEAKGAKGAKLSDAQIEKIARKFIKEYGSQADPRVIADGLKSMYEYIDATSKVSASQLGKIAHDYAREILNTASETDDTLGQLYPELRDGFKKAKLKLTDELKGDIVYNYDSIPNFKRQMRGVLDISEKGTQGVDTYYEELKGMYPDLFPDDIINPSDQLQRIAEVAEMLQKHTVKTDFGEDLDEVAYVLGQEMLAQYFAEKGDSTHKREVAAIKAEMTKKHQAEMAAVRADAAKEYQKLKDRLGSKAMKVAEVRAELNAMHRRVMERRELRLLTKEAKKRLMKQAKALWKLKGSAEFESAKRDLIGNLDLVSYGMSDGTRLNLEKIRKDALTQAAQDPDYAMSAEFADAQKLYERLNKQRISDMSLEQIESLTKAALALKNSQQTYNRMLKEELGDYVADYGSRLITQQQLISGIRGKSHMMNALKRYALYMENPTRAAHLLDGYQQNGVFTELFDDINEGAIRAESFRQRADEMFRPVLEDKELTRTWSKQNIPIKVGSDTYYISKGMRIAIYLHSLNNDNMRHIKKGGFTIPDEKLYRQGRYTEAYAAGKRVPMSEGTVREIIAEMTPAEKKFAGVAKEFFNSVTKDAINEVSLQLKGFELAMVNNYMPIRTNPNFTQREIEGLVRDASIEGAGQFKDRVPGASNPILLEDIAQVIKRQTDTTAQYYGLAIPVRNANKVWNFTSYRFNNSVKDAVAKNWLTDGAKIFENVLTDIQAGARRGDTGSHLSNLAKGAYATSVLMGNVGVSLKQSASYPLAIHMLDAASLAKGIVGKVDREYMDSITPLSWARRHGMGGQVEVADVFRQKGMIDDNPMTQKMKDLTNWIQAVDVFTTDRLFVACEEFVKAHNPGLEVRGDEYNKMVADLYNSVLQRTQPSYGVMQRNELMRSSHAIMKALTMFKTQTFNMGGELLDAGLRVNALAELQKNGMATKADVADAKRKMVNVVGATILSQAMLAIIDVMGKALLHKMKPYRDEEGNVTLESVVAKTARDFGSSFFGLFFGLDVASQVASAFTGGKWYDVTAPQLDGINDATAAMSKWSEALSKYMNGSGTKTDLIKQSGNMAIKISGAFGIPANNVYNIANAVNLWVQDVQTGKVGTFESGYGILGITDTSLTAKQYKDRLYRAVDQYGYGTKEYEKAMDELKRKTGKEEKEIFGSPYDDLYQVYREHGENSQEFKNRVKFLEEIGKKPKDIAKALNNRGATVTIK